MLCVRKLQLSGCCSGGLFSSSVISWCTYCRQMSSFVTRAGALGPYVSATTQTVPSAARVLARPIVALERQPVYVAGTRKSFTAEGFAKKALNGNIGITSGIGVTTHTSQRRYSHTDLKIPDFGAAKKDAATQSTEEGRTNSQLFAYVMVGGAVGAPFVYGTKSMVTKFLSSMSAAADVRAMAKIEIKLDEIPEGKNMVFKWRGKPLFVRHRTAEEVDAVREVNIAELRDPAKDEDRVKEDSWLVLLGICTHLGCVPIANAGDFGGYYCPCHGSHYDASGRIRKGPAPLNLEIPEYTIEDGMLVVG